MSGGPAQARCKSCFASMYWVHTPDGKSMPMDVKPDPKGGFVLTLKSDGRLYATAFDSIAHGAGRNRYTSHFATCPKASEHRRG